MANVIGVDHIKIDCETNNIIDIKTGGPPFLGYDFYVNPKKTKHLIKVIKQQLKENDQPLVDITIVEDKVLKKNIWTEKKIIECIKKGYN